MAARLVVTVGRRTDYQYEREHERRRQHQQRQRLGSRHPLPLPDDSIPRISGGKCNRDQDGEPTDEASPSHKRARREKGTLPLDANQPLTTRGKPRARVYVACLQWYVAHTPHRLPAHPPFQPQPENPLRRRSACVSQLHSERKSGVQL